MPSVRLAEEFDSNVNVSRTNPERDLVSTLTPAVEMQMQTERATVSSTAGLGFWKYVNATEQDRIDHRFKLGGAYQATERGSIRGDLAYYKDSALYSQLEETGEVVTVSGDRKRYQFSTGYTYVTTPYSNVALDYSRVMNEYGPDTLVDYNTDNISFTYQHQLWTQKDTVAVQPFYSRFESDPSDTNTYGLYLGWTHLLSEVMDVKVFAGGRRSETEFTVVRQNLVQIAPPLPIFRIENETVTQVERDWGWLVDIALSRRWQNYTTTLGYTHDLEQSSTGSPIEVNRFHGSVSRTITARLSASLYGSLLLSKSTGDFNPIDTQSINVSPSLSYRLTEDHSLVVGYAYSRYTDNTLTQDQTYNRNRVWMALNLQWPKKWSM